MESNVGELGEAILACPLMLASMPEGDEAMSGVRTNLKTNIGENWFYHEPFVSWDRSAPERCKAASMSDSLSDIDRPNGESGEHAARHRHPH